MKGEIIIDKAAEAAKVGISFGSALAIAISWSINTSLFWAVVHGIFGWFYVVYYAIFLTRPA